jgi:hypothetical protein
MLMDVSVRNLGPFKDAAAISARAGNPDEHPENVLESDSCDQGILGAVLLYGPNCTGKSAILGSIETLRSMASGCPVTRFANPFALGSTDVASEISVSVGSRFIPYSYSMVFSKEGVVSESLYQYATGRRSMVFLRSGGTFRYGKGCVRNRRSAESSVGSDMAFLPAAAENDSGCAEALNEILGISTANIGLGKAMEMLSKDGELKNVVMRGLRIADFPVSDISLVGGEVRFSHEVDGSILELPAALESDGVLRATEVLTAVCEALINGRTVIADDLDVHLHPRVLRWIVEQFSSERNPNSSQLFASAHDTSLMDLKNLVRRDQIFLSDRRARDGSATISRLTDHGGIRKDVDLQKAYFGWRLESLPRISSSEQLLRR